MLHIISQKILRTVGAVVTAGALVLSLAACGNSSQPSTTSGQTLGEMTGVSAEGKPGEKPKVTFKTPFDVKNNTHQIIQEGDGEALKEGAHVCVHQIVFDPATGKEASSTWESKPDCTLIFSEKSMSPLFFNLFKKLKVHSTVALGIKNTPAQSSKDANSSNSSQKSQATEGYIVVITIMSTRSIPSRAQGKAVEGIDSALPKVTLDKDGKPSISGLDYKSDGTLKVQTLIEGEGPAVTEDQTLTVHYTGWVLGGDASDPFDSSWNRGTPIDFSLHSVIKGWTQGLVGQKVGSQVLLVIPPDLAYGDKAQGKIPANATLVFVVDILDAQ